MVARSWNVEDGGRIRDRLEGSQYVEDARSAVQRDRRCVRRLVVPDPGERAHVDAVVRVLVRDDDRVDLALRTVLEQSRQGGVPEVEDHAEAVVLEQEAGARAAGLGPGAARAEDGERPHRAANGWSVGTISLPSGTSEIGISLKFATPSGMPMIVRHSAIPVVRWPSASHQPANDDPDHVAEQRARAGARLVDHRPPERPQRVSRRSGTPRCRTGSSRSAHSR